MRHVFIPLVILIALAISGCKRPGSVEPHNNSVRVNSSSVLTLGGLQYKSGTACFTMKNFGSYKENVDLCRFTASRGELFEEHCWFAKCTNLNRATDATLSCNSYRKFELIATGKNMAD